MNRHNTVITCYQVNEINAADNSNSCHSNVVWFSTSIYTESAGAGCGPFSDVTVFRLVSFLTAQSIWDEGAGTISNSVCGPCSKAAVLAEDNNR